MTIGNYLLWILIAWSKFYSYSTLTDMYVIVNIYLGTDLGSLLWNRWCVFRNDWGFFNICALSRNRSSFLRYRCNTTFYFRVASWNAMRKRQATRRTYLTRLTKYFPLLTASTIRKPTNAVLTSWRIVHDSRSSLIFAENRAGVAHCRYISDEHRENCNERWWLHNWLI